MNLLILPLRTADHGAAKGRLYPFLPWLARAGHLFEVYPLAEAAGSGWDRQSWTHRLRFTGSYPRRLGRCVRGRFFDLAWIETGLPPHPPFYCQRLPHGLLPRQRVYDLDEAFAESIDCESGLASKFRRNWRGASGFTTAFPRVEASLTLPDGPVLELPSVLDWNRFRERRAPLAGHRIGWPGPPVEPENLKRFWPAMRELALVHEFELVLPAGMPAIEGLSISRYEYPPNNQKELFLSFDIGLLPTLPSAPPMARTTAELLALGVPLLAGASGAPGRLLRRSGAGYHADSTQEWLFGLRKLLPNPDLRGRLGERGREWARSALTVQALAPRLLEFLQTLASVEQGGRSANSGDHGCPSRHRDCKD